MHNDVVGAISHHPSPKKVENSSSQPTIVVGKRRVHRGPVRPPSRWWVCRTIKETTSRRQPFSPSIACWWPPLWRSYCAWCGCAKRVKQRRCWSYGKLSCPKKVEYSLHFNLLTQKKGLWRTRHNPSHRSAVCDGSVIKFDIVLIVTGFSLTIFKNSVLLDLRATTIPYN